MAALMRLYVLLIRTHPPVTSSALLEAMSSLHGHLHQRQRKRQYGHGHDRPDSHRGSPARGDRVTRQWGGWGGDSWGGSWGENALEAAW